MSIYDKGMITVLGCAALFIAVALPLILRKIPPNRVYGFRVPTTLNDPTAWYEANDTFGRWFIAATIVMTAVVYLLYATRALDANAFMIATLVAIVAPAIVGTIAAFSRLRSL